MKHIILSPYSRWVGDKTKENAKNYPHMQDLVTILWECGYTVTQIGVGDERKLVGCDYAFNLSLKELEGLLKRVGCFLSVDNFLHHMAHFLKIPGTVLWGPSDSRIFGYKDQQNIDSDRQFLRLDQFGFYHLDWVWPHKDKWLDAETVYEKMRE
jgi:ADP-heptose:LPS heptosyltransferase